MSSGAEGPSWSFLWHHYGWHLGHPSGGTHRWGDEKGPSHTSYSHEMLLEEP